MLFDCEKDIFESDKERNLYYKFFAGYFFNELIPKLEDRLEGFKNILQDAAKEAGWKSIPDIVFSESSTHVSFDNHSYMLGCNKDRGEFADILVHDQSNKILVAIEVKFLSGMSYNKDITQIEGRLNKIAKKMKNTTILPCILLKRDAWENTKKKKNRRGSLYKKWEDEKEKWPLILIWEDFIKFCQDKTVRNYLESQLRRKKQPRYEIQSDKFCSKGNCEYPPETKA